MPCANPQPVWRDPYHRSWGEQLFVGLLTLTAVALLLLVVAEVARALLPLLITTTVIVGVIGLLIGSRRSRW